VISLVERVITGIAFCNHFAAARDSVLLLVWFIPVRLETFGVVVRRQSSLSPSLVHETVLLDSQTQTKTKIATLRLHLL